MVSNMFRNNNQSGLIFQSKQQYRPGILVIVFLAFWLMLSGSTPVFAGAESDRPLANAGQQQLQIAAGFDSNRTLGDRMVLWGQYRVSFADYWRLHTGISFNTATGLVNALYMELGFEVAREDTFGFRVKFLGNQYGEYAKAANSIIVYVNWDNAVYFIDFGVNYRFLNINPAQLWNIFYYDNIPAESIYYYSLRRRFVMQDGRYRLDVEVNNHDPMYAGNLGAYGLFLKNRFTVNDKVAVLVSIGARQTGSTGLSATYYKTMIFWGVEVGL